MKFLYTLERRFGRFAIPNLMNYIIAANLAVFAGNLLAPQLNLEGFLYLDPALVLHGQIWRLITFVFIPPSTSILWIVFVLYFYYLIGSSLEHEWGTFKFNLYYLIGMLGTAAASFITGGGGTPVYLNLSLFLAFAAIFPNYQILIFFILPVKVKYLAWLDWAFIIFTILTGDLPLKIAAIVSVINYFIFFGKDMTAQIKLNSQVHHNRKRFFDEIKEAQRNIKNRQND